MVCFYYYYIYFFLTLLHSNTKKEDCPLLVIVYIYNKHQIGEMGEEHVLSTAGRKPGSFRGNSSEIQTITLSIRIYLSLLCDTDGVKVESHNRDHSRPFTSQHLESGKQQLPALDCAKLPVNGARC